MLLLASSCAPQRRPLLDALMGRPLDQVYNQTRREGLQAGAEAMRRELAIQGTLGYVRPGVPVRTPPTVMAVWIPAFVNTEGDMVSGHWVYMVRQQEKWFIEEETGPGAAAVTVPRSHPIPRRSATLPPAHPPGATPAGGAALPNVAVPSLVPSGDLRAGNPRGGGTATQTTAPPTLIPTTPRVPVGGQP
jgi:Type IV conjugative transfer system lipoprotein (TraV)